MSAVEANVAIMNGLYNNWSIANPGKDTVGWVEPNGTVHLLDSKDPAKVHFTTRRYGYAPLRTHTFQISVRRLPESFRPASPGIPTKYLAEKTVLADIWVLTGPQQSIETAETFYFNMVQEVKRIIRTNAPNSFAPAFVSVIIQNISHDEAALRRNPPHLHAQMTILAVDFEVI
jgi:hypothetical protein